MSLQSLQPIATIVGALGWGLSWILFRCEAAWHERDELSKWIGAIFVAGIAEGFWAGLPVKNEDVNCDPASLLVGRLCSDERETWFARREIKKLSKKFCCNGDCCKVMGKASKWYAKGKDIEVTVIAEIIVKTSLMEAAMTRKRLEEVGKYAREVINSLPRCAQDYNSSSWLNCAEPACNIGFFVAVLICARSVVCNINGKTGNTIIDKGLLLRHSDADMFYGAEAVARFIDDPSVNNPRQQLFYMMSETYHPELISSKEILLKHQIQSGACGWAFLPISKSEGIEFDRRPRICQKAIGKKYFLHVAMIQVIIGLVLSILRREIFTFLTFFAGAGITIFWSVNGIMNSYVLHGLLVPVRISFIVTFGCFISLLLLNVGPNGKLNILGIIQAGLPVLGLIFWWIGYFIKHKSGNIVFGMGVIMFILKFAFMIFGLIVKTSEKPII